MTDFDTRLTALDRALIGASSGDFHDDVVERARAFEAYLTGESAEAAAAPEPRPFQVGDKVFVAKGASFHCSGDTFRSDIDAPCDAVVVGGPDRDGDLPIEHAVTGSRHLSAPSYLTLKEASA